MKLIQIRALPAGTFSNSVPFFDDFLKKEKEDVLSNFFFQSYFQVCTSWISSVLNLKSNLNFCGKTMSLIIFLVKLKFDSGAKFQRKKKITIGLENLSSRKIYLSGEKCHTSKILGEIFHQFLWKKHCFSHVCKIHQKKHLNR